MFYCIQSLRPYEHKTDASLCKTNSPVRIRIATKNENVCLLPNALRSLCLGSIVCQQLGAQILWGRSQIRFRARLQNRLPKKKRRPKLKHKLLVPWMPFWFALELKTWNITPCFLLTLLFLSQSPDTFSLLQIFALISPTTPATLFVTKPLWTIGSLVKTVCTNLAWVFEQVRFVREKAALCAINSCQAQQWYTSSWATTTRFWFTSGAA